MKLYPSSAAFLKGRLVHTDRKSGCLRKTYLEQNGVREPFIANDSKELGAAYEERVEQELSTTFPTAPEREVSFQAPVGEGHILSGRMDFIAPGAILEVKATRSSTLATNLRQGRPVTEHVAQLVSYMVAREVGIGQLRYGYFIKDTLKQEWVFTFTLDELGQILKDGTPFGYTVYDLLDHQLAQIHVAETNEIWDRPHNWSAKYGSPCGMCPFAAVCEEWDAGAITEVSSFKKRCLTAVEEYAIKGRPGAARP